MGPPRSVDRLRTIRRLAVVTTAGLCVLVVAGGVVRLTGSGLGCDDWPNCNSERFIDVSSGHAAIEQINRLLSGLIGIPTLLLAVLAFRTRKSEVAGRRLWWPAFGVLVTVLANGIVGGIAVRGDLHPALVQSHFLLAMVSIACALVVVMRTQPPTPGRVDPLTSRIVFVLGVFTAAALVSGTIVTGTGPHAGDENARRFGFDISNVARIHSVTVIAALLVALVVAARVRRDDLARTTLATNLSTWTFVAMTQALIGYVQYFTGVPEMLVAVHLALATALWVVTVRVVASCVGLKVESGDEVDRRTMTSHVIGSA